MLQKSLSRLTQIGKKYIHDEFICQFRTIHSETFPGKIVQINEFKIHYEEVGSGPHKLLMLPGALGTTRSDFKPQLEHLNRNEFTIIAWDPPGYGYSRPPNRSFSTNFYRHDAQIAADFMKALKHDNYSLFGWSDGAITGMIMAAQYPTRINKLLALAGSAFMTEKDVAFYRAIRNISLWSDKMKAPLIKIYGEEYFKWLWETMCDTIEELKEKHDGNICKEDLAKIVCPTLIVQGDKDQAVDPSHPHYLKKHIKNSKLIIFEGGKHNLHLRYFEKFNKILEDFLSSN